MVNLVSSPDVWIFMDIYGYLEVYGLPYQFIMQGAIDTVILFKGGVRCGQETAQIGGRLAVEREIVDMY